MSHPETLFVGKTILWLEETQSSNSFMADQLKVSDMSDGWVVVASHQTEGKGTSGNKWEDEKGKNLLFSVLLKPGFIPARNQFLLNQIICLAIADAIESMFDLKVMLKWPNDIFIHEKKIGGVLIENVLMGNSIKQSIIGIGINVNQKQFDNKIMQAESLTNLVNAEIDITKILLTILKRIEVYYLTCQAGKILEIGSNYKNRLLGINEKRKYKIGDMIVDGIIKGLSDEGQLQIEIKNELIQFGFKEIEFLID